MNRKSARKLLGMADVYLRDPASTGEQGTQAHKQAELMQLAVEVLVSTMYHDRTKLV